jgi:hypothetical protein
MFAFLVSAPSAEAQGVRITVAPPAMRVEVRPVAPSPRHVWTPGFWQWTRGRHVWVGGTYVLPPATGRVWVEARWVNDGGQWIFHEGHWGSGGGAVVVQPAPAPVVVQPAPRTVVVPPQPPPQVIVAPGPGPGPGWQGKGKGWKGKGKGWKGKGKDWH